MYVLETFFVKTVSTLYSCIIVYIMVNIMLFC